MAWVWSMQCLGSFGLLKHLCEFTQKQLEIEYPLAVTPRFLLTSTIA